MVRLAAANSPASARSGQSRTASAATAAASMSSAIGSRAVDQDAPDSVTSFGGPSPSNDRITTQGSRDAVHSAPAAITSNSWASPIVSRLVFAVSRTALASAIAARVRSDQRLSRGDRIQHRPRLVARLGVFVRPVRVSHYPTAGLDIGGAAAHQRSADGDGEVSIAGEVEVSDHAAVEAAARLFHLFDQLHGPHFWGTRQGPRREAGRTRIQGGAALTEHPGHRGHQVHHVAIALDMAVILDANSARRTNPPEVVAAQVDKHQVLGSLFVIGQQLLSQQLILFLVLPPPPGSGDR